MEVSKHVHPHRVSLRAAISPRALHEHIVTLKKDLSSTKDSEFRTHREREIQACYLAHNPCSKFTSLNTQFSKISVLTLQIPDFWYY